MQRVASEGRSPLEGRSSGMSSYRQREATQYRGVTKTSGTNSGMEKYDVQFVFCDQGTKKHPKIYGFSSAQAAARAFDLLTCKRALEKSHSVQSVLGCTQALGTNHPAADYTNEELLTMLHTNSRDDVIYALKQCAKRGYSLEPSNMLAEVAMSLDASRLEAQEKERMGDARQSYEPTAKPSGDRKRKPPQAPGLGRLASVPSTLTTLPSYSSAQLQQQAAQQEQQQLMALMAGMGASFPTQQKQQGSGAGAGSEAAPGLAQQPSANLTAGDMAGLAALAAGLLRGTPAEADATRTAARLAAAAGGSTRLPDLRSQPSPSLASLAAAAAASAPAPSGGAQQQTMLMQLLQSQASLGGGLAGSGGGSGDGRSGGAFRVPSTAAKAEPNPAPGLEGVEFLLDCLRLGMAASPELSCAHDVVRLWVCLVQGKPWANEQYNLPQWYYMGLVPHVQACTSLPALLQFCGHLWQSGALRVMLAAFAGNLPQATVITLLQSVTAAAAVAAPAAHEPTLLPLADLGVQQASQQQQATALVVAALQQAQQAQQAQQQAQQLGALKAAAAALLGAGNSPAAPAAAVEPANGLTPALQQLLQQLAGGGSGGGGAAGGRSGTTPLLQAQPSRNLAAQPAAAAVDLGDGPPQLAQLMQLLVGGTGGGGAANAASPNTTTTKAGTERRSNAPKAARGEEASAAGGPDKAAAVAGSPSAAQRGRSPSTETDGSSLGRVGSGEGQTAPSQARAASPQPQALKQEPGVDGVAEEMDKKDGEASDADHEDHPSKKLKTVRSRSPPTVDLRRPDLSAALAAAGESLMSKLLAAPRHAQQAQQVGSGGPVSPGVAGDGDAAAGTANGLGHSQPSLPTRPQPFKGSCDLGPLTGQQSAPAWAPPAAPQQQGTNGGAGGAPSAANAGGSKLDLLSQAASLDLGGQGAKKNSAFSRFQHQQQAAAAAKPAAS